MAKKTESLPVEVKQIITTKNSDRGIELMDRLYKSMTARGYECKIIDGKDEIKLEAVQQTTGEF